MTTQAVSGNRTAPPLQRVQKKRRSSCCLFEKIKTLALRIFTFIKEKFRLLGKKIKAALAKKSPPNPMNHPQDKRSVYYLQIPADVAQRTLEYKRFLYRDAALTPPEDLPDNVERDTQIKKVQENGLELKHMSPEAQDDEQLVILAVNENWRARQFASERLKKADKDYLFNPKAQAIAKVQRSPIMLGSKELEAFIDDFDVVAEAVKRSSAALNFASPRLQDNVEIKQLADQRAKRELKPKKV